MKRMLFLLCFVMMANIEAGSRRRGGKSNRQVRTDFDYPRLPEPYKKKEKPKIPKDVFMKKRSKNK